MAVAVLSSCPGRAVSKNRRSSRRPDPLDEVRHEGQRHRGAEVVVRRDGAEAAAAHAAGGPGRLRRRRTARSPRRVSRAPPPRGERRRTAAPAVARAARAAIRERPPSRSRARPTSTNVPPVRVVPGASGSGIRFDEVDVLACRAFASPPNPANRRRARRAAAATAGATRSARLPLR